MSDINFEINISIFLNALNNVKRAILSNSPIPSQSGVKIEGKNNLLVLTGTGDISIQITLSNALNQSTNLSLINEGCIVMNPNVLTTILSTAKSENIKIESMDGNLIHIQGENCEYRINGFSADEYINVDFTRFSENSLAIDYATLCEIINSTFFAVSENDMRVVLKGVNFNAENNELIVSATDSFRLAQKKIPYSGENFNVTVPLKCLNEARAIFANEKNFSIYIDNKKIQFISEAVILQSSLIEGSYPEVNRLIPNEFISTLVINRSYFLDALERTSFIKVDNMSTVKIQMNNKDDIIFYNWNMETGESKEVVKNDQVLSYEGNPMELSFCGNYVISALKALKAEYVIIKFTGIMKPFIIQDDDTDQSVLQLVLPIKTYH